MILQECTFRVVAKVVGTYVSVTHRDAVTSSAPGITQKMCGYLLRDVT